MKLARIAALGAAMLIIAAGAAACGDDNNDGGGKTPAAAATKKPAGTATTGAAKTQPATTATTGAAKTQPATTTTTTPGAGGVNVTATDFKFTPADLSSAAGAVKVTLKNSGSAQHTFTLYKDDTYASQIESADTGQVAPGSSKTFTVTLAAGTYAFRCNVHPTQMKGTLTAR